LLLAVDLTMRIETLWWSKGMVKFTRNGKSSMLKTMQKNQPRESLTRSLDSMSKETSTLSLNFHSTDTSMYLITETWQSRLRQEERPKFGTSINNPWPSELDTTTNLGTSRVLERLITCKSGQLTQDGSNYSSSRITNSSTGPTIRFLM
jgi:hypothetical protein